jgi:hypothetical protein
VAEVLILPDGRVLAVAELRSPFGTGTFGYVLIQQGDRYLIDGIVDVVFEPAGTPPAGAPGTGTPPA